MPRDPGGSFGDAHLEDLLDPALLRKVLSRLQVVVGRTGVAPGRTVPPVNVNPGALAKLLPAALVVAAGLDRATTPSPPPPLLWDDGTNQLLVHLTDTSVRTGSGFVDLTLVVECDQTGRVEVVSTFLTATPDRPGGVVWATEDRPRGDATVVNRWGEALVALGWRTLLELLRTVSAAQGTDTVDRPLVVSTAVASPDGLMITAMGAHPFMTTASS